MDTESGLVAMRHRMYDPKLGRFTQTDPILGRRASAHYSYGGNNPVNQIDPMGLQEGPAIEREAYGRKYICECDRNVLGFMFEWMGLSPSIGRNLNSICTCGTTHEQRDELRSRYGRALTTTTLDTVKALPGANAVVAAQQIDSGYSVSLDSKPVSRTETVTELAVTTGMYVGLKGAGDYAGGMRSTALKPLVGQSGSTLEPLYSPPNSETPLKLQADSEGNLKARAYSTAFEFQLDKADFLRSEKVHFNRANAALDKALQGNQDYADAMEEMIPGIRASVSKVGGRDTPEGWIWHHARSNTAEGRLGILRLVPEEQHTPGSYWWRTLHPDKGAAGGFSELQAGEDR